ncbi:MAG: ABC transporter permease [Candidatus Latescibacter sp.]|nr:ABC transporter permease [Candidatus Latescibacter sp.]
MIRRLFAIIHKEINHILRDPRTLIVLFAMPATMVVLFGFALNMDIEHIPIAVIDRDNTPESRDFIRAFTGSKYFSVKYRIDTADQVENLFRNRKIKAALVIPDGFGKDFAARPEADIQLLVDGSDPTYGQAVVNYSSAIAITYSVSSPAAARLIPVDIRDIFLYNPDLKGSNFITPGLVAVILMMACALLTSITIAREKETGTMDVLMVSPVRPIEIVVGKVIPYVGVSLINAVFILTFAKLVFNIPLRGDLVLLLGLSVIYVYCALGIGLFISSIAKSQQVAMMAALVATIMPSILLSGFMFPIFSMPAPIRIITYLVPAKYYLEIIRGILLKSSTFSQLQGQVLFLAVLGTAFVIIASLRFKTRVQ